MSSAKLEIDAQVRELAGKGASRRLRREQNQFPGILYGGKETPLNIMLDHQKMMHFLENESVYSQILTLNVQGKKQKVILKALQRHHFKKAILHADFQRVSAKDKIHMRIPLHFLNEDQAPGIKEGGLLNHQAIDVEIRCQADQLPEFIAVDVSHLALDETIHLSQLPVPPGVELIALSHQNDMPVVSIHLPRVVEEEQPVTEESAEGAAASTTEGSASAEAVASEDKN